MSTDTLPTSPTLQEVKRLFEQVSNNRLDLPPAWQITHKELIYKALVQQPDLYSIICSELRNDAMFAQIGSKYNLHLDDITNEQLLSDKTFIKRTMKHTTENFYDHPEQFQTDENLLISLRSRFVQCSIIGTNHFFAQMILHLDKDQMRKMLTDPQEIMLIAPKEMQTRFNDLVNNKNVPENYILKKRKWNESPTPNKE